MLSRARSRYLTLVRLVAVLPLCIGFSRVGVRVHTWVCVRALHILPWTLSK